MLKATGPQQVWSWDITDLRSPWRGVAFKAYSIIDIFSRKIVGWRVEEREVDALAVQMFEDAFTDHGVPAAVHADSGPAMRSHDLKKLLADHSVVETHNRPRVSNDNPFSESEFRTMNTDPTTPASSSPSTTPAPTWPSMCPGTTPNTSILGSRCSPRIRSMTAPGANTGSAVSTPSRPTTKPTQNGSDKSHEHQAPPTPSASTSPTPNDSKQLDNARWVQRHRQSR